MDGVAGISAWSSWRSGVACWGACRYNMGSVSAHEAQYAGAAVPPRWRGSCARATVVAGRLAASRRVVRHDRTARSWSWAYCLVVVGGNLQSKVGWRRPVSSCQTSARPSP